MNAQTLPAHLQGYATPDITDRLAGNLGVGSVPYVSIMGNRLTLVDSTGDEEAITTVDPKTGIPYLDCCIADVGDHPSKIYYAKAFDPNAAGYAPPDCWSDNGIGPSTLCSSPQARSCTPDPEGVHGCKLAVWGSATSKVSGKGIPACAKNQKLALVLPGDDITFLLRVPPNSLDNLKAYNLKFKGQPFSIRDVVTRISFEAGGIGTLTFMATGFIDPALLKQRQAVLAEKKTDAIVGRGDKPIGGQLAGGQAAAALPPPSAPGAGVQNQGVSITPPAGAQTAATTSPSEPPKTRRRRNAAPAEGGQAPASAQVAQQAPFRPSDPPVGGQAPNPAPFGMAEGVAPNADLAASINSVFGPR